MKINVLNPTSSDDVRIEVVPLIDVIFCILTFFILAALQLTRQQAINIDLPKASTSAIQTRQTLIVSIDSIGQRYIDRTPVSEEQLYLLLEGYRRTNPQGLMVLYADRSAIYEDVVKLLDLMRAVGGDRVALATQTTNTPILPGGPGSTPGSPPGSAPGALPGGFPGTLPPLPNDPNSAPFPPSSTPGSAFPGLPNGAPGGLPSALPSGLPNDPAGAPTIPAPEGGNRGPDSAAPPPALP